MIPENIKIQDHVPQKVLDPPGEAEKASKRSATAPAVATFLAVEGDTAGAPSHTQLVQRLETLEAMASKLEQRLSALEQGQLYKLSLPVKAASTVTGFQPAEVPQEVALLAVVPTCKSAEAIEVQAGSADEQPTAPLLPLDTLSPEVWRKGLVTNQLVARLQTNPTTLKKYLRDLKQVQWAVHRDPDGLGWVYDSPLQCYYPLRVESTDDVSPQGLPTLLVNAESGPEPSQRHEVALQDKPDAIEYGYLSGQGGLYQSDFARLTGIPVNTLQRWKQL